MIYNLSLIFIFIINTKFNVIYASKITEGNVNINWFQIGPQYINVPAVGWCMLTFILFLIILFYILHFYLLNLVKLRHSKIKKISSNSRKTKALLNKELSRYQKHNKALSMFTEEIILKIYNKIKIDQTKHKMKISLFFTQLNDSFIDIIKNHVLLLKNSIKNNFIEKTIKEVVKQNKNRMQKRLIITNHLKKQIKNIFYTYCKGK